MVIKTREDLKKAFAEEKREEGSPLPNNYLPFWNMKVGERAVVRFLPDLKDDNPKGFLVEKVMHTLELNGEKKSVPCLSMYGEDCPICKVSQEFYRKEDKVNGKKYWRKKQYLAQGIVLEDPLPADQNTGETAVGKVRFFNLGYQLYNIIKEAFQSDELENIPYMYKGGYDFIIKKSQQGEYPTYAVGSKFKNAPRDLSDEELAVIEASMIDLSTLLPRKPDRERVEAMLDAALSGGVYEDPAKASKPATASANSDEAPVATQKSSASDDDVEDEDVEAMLANLKARKK